MDGKSIAAATLQEVADSLKGDEGTVVSVVLGRRTSLGKRRSASHSSAHLSTVRHQSTRLQTGAVRCINHGRTVYISDCTDNIILGILQLDMCVSLHAACTQHLARGMPVDMLIREVCCANASQNL